MQNFLMKFSTERETSVFDRSLDFLIALLPAVIASTVFFGVRALVCMLLCAAAAALSEFVFSKLFKIQSDYRDLSAVVCGLLIGMTTPSAFPVPAAVTCAFVAIAVARVFFGGYGCEIVSPVALGAVLCFVCFSAVFKYTDAFTGFPAENISISEGAKNFNLPQLLFGAHAGAIGETPALFLAVGALYLCLRRIISPILPLSALLGTALFSLIFKLPLLPALLGGGVILASVFILNDHALSPKNLFGKVATGLVFSFITVIIRKYASADEGVYFAVLTVNILRPIFEAVPNPFANIKREAKNEN